MRDFLDGILNAIGATSLTDIEFDTVTASFAILEEATYNDLSAILISRGGVSDDSARLVAYYKANAGIDVVPVFDRSNIFLGEAF